MHRDRLVCGIDDDSLQRRLLTEPGLTYAKAVDLAQRNETASQHVKDLRAGQQPIHRVGDNSRSKDLTCFRCGKKDMFLLNIESAPVLFVKILQRACKRSKPVAPNRGNVRRVKEQSPETSDQGSENLIGNVSLHATTASIKCTSPLWLT